MEGGLPADSTGPSRIGKYEIGKVLGRGSIGIVYEALDVVLKRKVAIKKFHFVDLDTPLGHEKYQRFQREAQAAARLYHPNITMTFDYGETDAFAYIVMEYIEGPSIRELIEKSRVGLDQMKTIMQGLLAGLQHSHSQGVIHRDIKPANILLNQDGEVKITDFGIAHLDDSDLTQLGSQVGTPAYMPPEQVLGGKVDARADLYSAGVILYEMLTGRRPFEGSTNSVMHKIVHAPAPRVSESTAAFPPGLDTVVAKVLAKDPNDRYDSAAEFWSALSLKLHHAAPEETRLRMLEPTADSTIMQVGSRPPDVSDSKISVATASPRRFAPGLIAAMVGVVCIGLGEVAWVSVHRPGNGGGVNTAVPRASDPESKMAAGNIPANLPSASSNVASSGAAIPPLPAVAAPSPPMTPGQEPVQPPYKGAISAASPPPATDKEPAESLRTAPIPAESPPATVDNRPDEPLRTAAISADNQPNLLAGLQGIVAKIPCSLVRAELDNSTAVTLNGLSGLGEASEMEIRGFVRQSVAQLVPAASVAWKVGRIAGPYCAIFDLLRPISNGGENAPSVSASAPAANASSPQTGTGSFRVTLPVSATSLVVDLYSSEGLVHHLVPVGEASGREFTVKIEAPIEPPASTSEANPTENALRPSLLVAIASSKPLLDAARPPEEAAAGYLKALGKALAPLSATGAVVSADATGVGPTFLK